ncbi:extracellular solute-binding protein [Hassallia byssoidea VB512170]|uniref:Extracellular solute-binding protein n=1 Tax=Hassallia byssoidea VB512170 TaxID=1304833 RepID=A0A846H6V0_9CYAN|nr:extracellular solute-binding protein [Hassalia byssoidea]NEU72319.1 extracellular solute-binding protein [Hassalia byssoidea VB512170]
MNKHLFAVSLVTCVCSVMLPNQAFAAVLYNAGSLGNALKEVSSDFTQIYGIPVTQVSGPSGSIRERIEKELSEGASADVFASADIGNPQQLYDKGLSQPVVNFIDNRLVAIVKPGLSVTSDNLLDYLLNPEIKLGTSTPIKDPSGDYAQEIFRKADNIKPGNYDILNNKALQLVGGNPNAPTVPEGKNSLVYFVKETQQADVFLAYYTSGLAARDIASDLQIVELPDNLAVRAKYGLTVLKNASPEGDKLAKYILSPDGQKVLLKYGFTSAKSTSVPESQGVGGVILAVSVAFALQKKLVAYKKQQVKVKINI